MSTTENKIVDAEIISADDENFVDFEGMSEEEARAFKPIIQRFMTSYAQKSETVTTEIWLSQRLAEELPEKTPEEIQTITQEIVSSVTQFNENVMSVNAACEKGTPAEVWFEEKIQDAFHNLPINEYGNKVATYDRALFQSNEQMLRTLQRKDGGVNQNPNLDGFIAEQQHVNDFNEAAAVDGTEYTAKVQGPSPHGYTKNSFDIVITDKAGKIVHQYQAKFCKDYKATIKAIRSGDYTNQRLLVPTEQLDEVQKAFPNKTVTDHIGGSGEVKTKSKALSKADVKKMQLDAQSKSEIKASDWDKETASKVAINLGQNVLLSGGIAARNAIGFHIAKKIWNGEEIKANEVVKVALEAGADAGVKTAAAGALTVASQKGIISMLPKGTPAGLIANIAAAGVENAKILWRCAKGEISLTKALDLMGQTNSAMYVGAIAATKGAAIGASLGSVVPVVGTAVGGFIGGTLGYMAGSTVGQAVYNGAKKVAKAAKSFVETTYQAAKSVGEAVCSGAKTVVKSVASAVGSVVSAVGKGLEAVGNFFSSIFS